MSLYKSLLILALMFDMYSALVSSSFHPHFFSFQLFSVIPDDTSLMYLISGPGVDEYPEIGLFSIEEHESGKIYVHRTVDRETTPSFMVPKI